MQILTLAHLTTQKLLVYGKIHNSNYNSTVNRIAIAIGRKLIVHFKQLKDHKDAQQKKAEDEKPQPKKDLVKKPISPSKQIPTH